MDARCGIITTHFEDELQDCFFARLYLARVFCSDELGQCDDGVGANDGLLVANPADEAIPQDIVGIAAGIQSAGWMI